MKNPDNPDLNINVRLLRRIQKHILKYRKAFNMGNWGEGFKFTPKTKKEPDCGTTACIAGWAVALGREGGVGKLSQYMIPIEARKLLGLTKSQVNQLFVYKGERYLFSDVKPEEAAKAIDKFIADPSNFTSYS